MSNKQSYWIVSAGGEYAQVEGADERDRWTRVLGWRLAIAEPTPSTQVHIVHQDGMQGLIPFEALAGGWSGLGWTAGPPPEPVDITKDSRLVDQSTAVPEPIAEPVNPKSPASSGGDKIKGA